MARTLKGTGIAASLHALVCVDDDNTTIKEFVASRSLTIANITPHTSKTWKSVTVPMMPFGVSSTITFATAPSVSSPCCYFYLMKQAVSPTDNDILFRSASTSGGSIDVTKATLIINSTPQMVLRDQSGGTALAFPNLTQANGDSYGLFLNDASSGDNLIYYSTEASTITGVTHTRADPGVNVTTSSPREIGGGVRGDIVMFGIVSGVISQADAASIHADPFGTLFTSGASVAPLASYYARLRA